MIDTQAIRQRWEAEKKTWSAPVFPLKYIIIVMFIFSKTSYASDRMDSEVKRINTINSITNLHLIKKDQDDIIIKIRGDSGNGSYIWNYLTLFQSTNLRKIDELFEDKVVVGIFESDGRASSISTTEWLDQDGCVNQFPVFYQVHKNGAYQTFLQLFVRTSSENEYKFKIKFYKIFENLNKNPGFSNLYFSNLAEKYVSSKYCDKNSLLLLSDKSINDFLNH